MGKLFKEAEKLKKVLSANNAHFAQVCWIFSIVFPELLLIEMSWHGTIILRHMCFHVIMIIVPVSFPENLSVIFVTRRDGEIMIEHITIMD